MPKGFPAIMAPIKRKASQSKQKAPVPTAESSRDELGDSREKRRKRNAILDDDDIPSSITGSLQVR